jgi:hypothetical protein
MSALLKFVGLPLFAASRRSKRNCYELPACPFISTPASSTDTWQEEINETSLITSSKHLILCKKINYKANPLKLRNSLDVIVGDPLRHRIGAWIRPSISAAPVAPRWCIACRQVTT